MTIRTYLYKAGLARPVFPLYIRVGTWREVEGMWRWEGGSWHQVYEKQVPVTVTLNAIADDTSGDTVTLSGTVTSPYGNVTVGTVEVWRKMASESDAAYAAVHTGIPVVNGAWSVSHTFVDVGTFVYQARYVPGDGPEQPATSGSDTVSIGLNNMPLLYIVSNQQTSTRFNWSAVNGATHYDIYNGAAFLKTVTSPDSGTINLSANTTYSWRVRARRVSPDGVTIYSTYSAYLYTNGGRPEIRDTGSYTLTKNAIATGNYRYDFAGWGYQDDRVMQGYYSSPYGGYGYRGVIDYGDNGVWNALVAAIGSTRAANFVVSACSVRLRRYSGIGAYNSPVTIRLCASESAVNGGIVGAYDCLFKTASPATTTDVHQLGTAVGYEMIHNKRRSLLMYVDTSAAYAGFYGISEGGSTMGQMVVSGSWNYVTQTYIAPSWWR